MRLWPFINDVNEITDIKTFGNITIRYDFNLTYAES